MLAALELTFLVMMKEVPIARELEMARARPMYLSRWPSTVMGSMRSHATQRRGRGDGQGRTGRGAEDEDNVDGVSFASSHHTTPQPHRVHHHTPTHTAAAMVRTSDVILILGRSSPCPSSHPHSPRSSPSQHHLPTRNGRLPHWMLLCALPLPGPGDETDGCGTLGDLLINIGLTLLGVLPGHVHGFVSLYLARSVSTGANRFSLSPRYLGLKVVDRKSSL